MDTLKSNSSENLKETIEILGPEQWQEHREIRLKALKTDTTSFGESYEREEKKSEQGLRTLLVDTNYKNYIAKVGRKIAAIVAYSLSKPQNVEHGAMISSVSTDPDFRRRGLSEKLMKRMISDLHANPKITRLRLSVRNDNEIAKGLYTKLGFVQFGISHKEMKVNGVYYDQAQMELIFDDKI